jgi:sulfatase modifying factor 1
MKSSRLHKLLGLTLAGGGLLAQTASALITIDTVPVGNAGNAADQNYLGQGAFGAVSYDYGIGKYDVTLNQYSAFLNAVAKTDTYGLYNASMRTDPNIAGIAQNGVSGSYTYSVIGSGNRPVTYVSWFDSARFANWMQNGQPMGAQAAGTTETGAYTLNGALSGIITRNAGATYGLPSENEWYKAAYYDQSLNSGSGGYWLYPTRSNTQPNSRNGSASDPNSANYFFDDGIANGFNGGYAVNNSTNFPTGNALTDVGAFSLARSFYGTFDQGGNVYEWNDAVIGSGRGLRGGAWNSSEISLRALFRHSDVPTVEYGLVGFRVVIVPEPSVVGLMGLGIITLAARKRK